LSVRAKQVCNILPLITVNAAGARTRQMRPWRDQERFRTTVREPFSKIRTRIRPVIPSKEARTTCREWQPISLPVPGRTFLSSHPLAARIQMIALNFVKQGAITDV
jgi:hypothetical protein